MIDFPKLVLRLRTQQAVYEKADAFNLADDARQAADAIEQLEKDVARAKEWASFWEKEATEALKKFQVAVASKPRWVSVTEEQDGKV